MLLSLRDLLTIWLNILVLVRSAAFQRFFSKLLDGKPFFSWNCRKCLSQIEKVFWQHLSPFVVLAVTINVISSQELFVEHDDDL